MQRSSTLVNLLLCSTLLLPAIAPAQSPEPEREVRRGEQDTEREASRDEREAMRRVLQALRAERESLRAEARSAMRAELQAARAELADAARHLAQTQRRMVEAETDALRKHMEVEADADGKHIRITIENAVDREFDSATPQLGILLRERRGDNEVLGLTPGGGAEQAGLMRGDRIVAINGATLNDRLSIPDALEDVDPGAVVTVTVSRDGEERQFEVETSAPDRDIRVFARRFAPGADFDTESLAEGLTSMDFDFSELEADIEAMEREIRHLQRRGDAAPEPPLAPLPGLAALGAGVELASNHPGLESYFGTGDGVLVLRVAPDNPLGLAAGDVILRIGARALKRPVDLGRAVLDYEPGDTLTLDIMRRGARESIEGRVPEVAPPHAGHGPAPKPPAAPRVPALEPAGPGPGAVFDAH